MTAIIDYKVGNLFSLRSSLQKIGQQVVITAEKSVIESAERIILPGVGAFEDAAEKLRATGLVPVLKEQAKHNKPILGICLGMQLLFEKSYEYGEHEGLAMISGNVQPIESVVKNLKIPHMGWNRLIFQQKNHPLFRYIQNGDYVYFVHSYYAADCADSILATTEYGAELTAAVASGSVMGCQFHPEKSGEVGLSILKAFCEMEAGKLC